MDFIYSRYNISGSQKALERRFEMLPGILSWSIILGMLLISYLSPVLGAIIMIAFVLYWVLRLIYMNIFLVISYFRLALEKKTDWPCLIGNIDRMKDGQVALNGQKEKCLKEKILFSIHAKQLQKLKESGNLPPNSTDIYHLVIIPVIKESRKIVEPGIDRIRNSVYPSKKIAIVIALEERSAPEIKKEMYEIQERYKDSFYDFFVIVHPDNLQNEAKVKGANTSYAAEIMAQYFRDKKIPYENIIISCFDADTVAESNYFACLTYYFMITPERTRTSFQPIPVYYNNIWEVPSFARIMDIGTSFFQMVEATNPNKLVTFSSHSMSFKALVEVGYWPRDMISDDSAIFWKSFIHFDGNYQTMPIYTTVSMDIAIGKNFKETCANIYKQKRRWAWGVENLPIVYRAFLNKGIPLGKKISHSFKLIAGFTSWATWSFLLTIISWLPAGLVGKEFATTTVYYTAPRIRFTIFSLASVGILICIVISLLLLPREKHDRNLGKRILHALEWVYIPAVILFLSALPALDAQTRLMFGRYMEFWVTDKGRKT